VKGRPVVVFGAGGHGKVVADAARSAGDKLLAFVDDEPVRAGTSIWGLPVVSWDQCVAEPEQWSEAGFALGIGENAARQEIQRRLEHAGRRVVSIAHARATISDTAVVAAGTVVLAGAVVNADAVIGRGCIVNTGAIVEHDCALESFVHLSPNAALGGNVSIGERTHVGIGATVLPGVRLGADVTVGAGAVVLRDVPDAQTVVGVPARPIEVKTRR
jgi:sugar O-acyltransferase (sialic acid O-acetyltransferase NeuD family)